MKIKITPGVRSIVIAASLLYAATPVTAPATTPQYQIYDIGVVQVGDTASQGFGMSHGGIAVGRSVRTGGSQAFTWTLKSGIVGLPSLPTRSYCVSNSANDDGIVVGTGTSDGRGNNPLPLIWQNGVVSQLPLPVGEEFGLAKSVNASDVAVGSVGSEFSQRGVLYSGGSASIITQTTPGGSYFVSAKGINDSGRIVGLGKDPKNQFRTVGIVYDIGSKMAFEVGWLPGMNGAIAYGVSNNGYVVGASGVGFGPTLPFIWSDKSGIVAIPLAAGTAQGEARAVNSAGWVVGYDESDLGFAIPFLYDGTTTYRLADLIPPNSGWDLSTNTSSTALGISEDGIIVGTGVHNDEIRAYAMVPARPTPTPRPRPTPTPRP